MSTAASDAVQIPQPRPRSLRSVSPSSDRSSSPLELDPSTLALLNNFYEERQDAEDKFKKLEEAAHARLLKAQSGTKTNASTNDGDDDNDVHEMISVDDFREMFGEDWQLSQFWSVHKPASTSLPSFPEPAHLSPVLSSGTPLHSQPGCRDLWPRSYRHRPIQLHARRHPTHRGLHSCAARPDSSLSLTCIQTTCARLDCSNLIAGSACSEASLTSLTTLTNQKTCPPSSSVQSNWPLRTHPS